MVIAVPDLLVLALFVFALALALSTKKVAQALLGGLIAALQAIPIIGGKLASPLEAAEAAITRAMDDLVNGIESGIGKAWHLQARLLDWTWHELEHHAKAIFLIATPLGGLLRLYHGVRSLIRTIEHDLHHGNRRFEEELKRFGRGIDRINSKIRGLDHRIEDVVLPRVRTAEREIAHLGDVVIPDIRDLVHGAEVDITALRKWITANLPLVGSTAFVGAIAAALSALGLGWLRCESNPFNNNRNACGLWGDLSALLGLAFIAAEVASLEELIGVAQTVTEGITQGVEDLLKV